MCLFFSRSEEHTSELQSRLHLVCRLLLEKKNREVRLFERQLERDAPTKRRADDDSAAQAAILHVALDEPREVPDRVADLRLPGSPLARQVGRGHAMPGRGGLEVEAPLHAAGGAEAVD